LDSYGPQPVERALALTFFSMSLTQTNALADFASQCRQSQPFSNSANVIQIHPQLTE
jgi:hypothetical protein